MAAKKKVWTAEEVVQRIRARYGDSKRYAVFEQVASGTGMMTHSWIDVVSVDLWPSDDYTRRAFEVKVSRGDFLAELKNHTKNEWARKCFHEFWYVAPAGVILDENELPENSGWLMPAGSRLITKRAASRREAEIDEPLFASICRSAQRDRQGQEDSIRADVLENDKTVARAIGVEKAVEAFLRSRDCYLRGHRPEDVRAALERVTGGEKDRRDAEQVQAMLASFREKMLDAYDTFCEAAYVGILEVDEAERFMLDRWGHLLGKDATQRAKERRMRAEESAEALDEIHETGRPETAEGGE